MEHLTLPLGAAVGALFFLLLLSAFFSGSETALTRARPAALRSLARQGHKGARTAEKLIGQPDRMLATILLGNNFVNIAASSLATAIFVDRFGEAGIVYATVAMTVIVLILAEILPKTVAVAHAEAIASGIATPMRFVQMLLSPLVRALMYVIDGLKRLLGIPEGGAAAPSHRELASMVSISAESGLLDRARGQMLQGSLRLHEVPVKALMTPRHEMVMLDGSRTVAECLREAAHRPYSRYPVYLERPDRLIGIVHLKELITIQPDDRKLSDAIGTRDVPYVPATKNALKQLFDFQARRQHMAIVVDEFGDIEGLITLEDIIEDIVGEIEDESDLPRPTRHIWPQHDGSIIAAGRAVIHDLNLALDAELPEQGATTLGGLIIRELGDTPEGPVCLKIGPVRIEVLAMEDEWIRRVRLRRADEPA